MVSNKKLFFFNPFIGVLLNLDCNPDNNYMPATDL